jgi:hypothetical protein
MAISCQSSLLMLFTSNFKKSGIVKNVSKKKKQMKYVDVQYQVDVNQTGQGEKIAASKIIAPINTWTTRASCVTRIFFSCIFWILGFWRIFRHFCI